MEIVARIRYWRIAPRKARLVADEVRGCGAEEAIDKLLFAPARGARGIRKLLKAAVAQADQRKGVDVDTLYVKRIAVDEGPIQKRFRTRARGRSSPIKKRTSHVTLVLDERR